MAEVRPVLPVQVNCPSCGVAVVVGAERCERCKALLPRSYTGAPRRRWLLWLVLALAVAGAVLWFVGGRGGGDRGTEAGPADRPPPATGATAGPSGPPPETAAGPADAPADRKAALDGLIVSMQNRNLQGTVKVEAAAPQVVHIEATRCDDRVRSLIAAHAAALRRAGVELVRCLAADGAIAFEEPL